MGGAVDLVCQDDIAHGRAGTELKFADLLVVNGKAADIGGHDVRGELNALIGAVDGPGQGGDQAGLSHTGDVLDQYMALGKHAEHGQLHLLVFALDDGLDVCDDLRDLPSGLLRLRFGKYLTVRSVRALFCEFAHMVFPPLC